MAYADSFGTGFALDPAELILKDLRIRAVNFENLNLILNNDYLWLNYSSGLYRPVTTASFLLNYVILGNGENPAGYHWVNFLLHVGNVWLVFGLARRLFGRSGPACFAAALWAVHPIGTEAVTNIGGRADLLAAMAVLGGLLLYVRGLDGERRLAMPAALFGVAVFGLFSKENAAVLVGLMLLWDTAWSKGAWWKAGVATGAARRLPAYAAVVASLALAWGVRQMVFRTLPWTQAPFVDNPLTGADFWTARLTAIKVAGMGLWLLVCPVELASDRSYNQIPLAGWAQASTWLALMIVAGIGALAVLRRRRDPLLFWAAGFFGIACLPTSNLILPIGSIMAERFLYLPSAGFAIAVAALAYRVRHQRLRTALLAAVLVLLTVRTYARNLAWQDNLTLAATDLKTAPRSFKLHTLLAQELIRRGARENIDRAIQEQEIAYGIVRPLPHQRIPQQSLIYLGDVYLIKGNMVGGPFTAEGRPWYEKALPVLERAREVSRMNEKDWDQAQRAHARPLGERFATQDLYYDLGIVYGSLGRYAEALETLQYGRDINPERPDFYPAISAAYVGLLKPDLAAMALLEGGLLDAKPDALTALREAYGKIPGGACAVLDAGGAWKLNLDCPRLRQDLCPAAADLARAFLEARRPPRAGDLKRDAVQRYGCSQ